MHRLRQLTFGKYGHMLNRRQSISPDGEWVVYDTRNEDAHIARTHAIEMVKMETGDITPLYRTRNQTVHGPGVGAVAFHPSDHKIIFIHGLESCSASNPYSAARRFGAIVDVAAPWEYLHAESRVVLPDAVTAMPSYGMLAGGTHAHSWSTDGWISFTYNDAYLEGRARIDNNVRDLRTVGFMVPGMELACDTPETEQENFIGDYAAFIAVEVKAEVRRGSDDVEQAVEECWIGTNGYTDAAGNDHQHAIAFQGAVRDEQGNLHHEIFVCDLPNLKELSEMGGVQPARRREGILASVPGCSQRRLTHTLQRKYPGVQGPRNWLVSSPDGEHVYFPMRDDAGIVQLHRLATKGGALEQISSLSHSIEGQISLNAHGTGCAFLSDQRVCLVNLGTGEHAWLTGTTEHKLFGAVQFIQDDRWVLNAYVGNQPDHYAQIFVCE